MGAEAFAEAASVALPGWRVQAVEDVAFLTPFKFYRDEPRELTVEATLSPGNGDDIVAECRLMGTRVLPSQPEPQVTIYFTGRVRMVPATTPPPVTARRVVPTSSNGAGAGGESIYRVYFHGPTYQVLERSWHEGDRQVGLMAEGLPPNHHPPNLPLVISPRLLELCFQTAGVWELGTSGRLALPQHVGRMVVMGSEEQISGRAYAVVTPTADGAGFDAEVIDSSGTLHICLEGYQTVVLPVRVEAGLLGPLEMAVQAAAQPAGQPAGR
jgi:hypothetical protein